MVTVIMGYKNNIRFWKFGIVSQPAKRIHMDDLPIKSKHQGSMADECDLKIAGGCFNGIFYIDQKS